MASIALIATLLAPWIEYTPFMDGFWGSEPEGPLILRGFESPGPGSVPAVLGLTGALLPLVADRRIRAVLGAMLFGMAAAWSAGFILTDGFWACVMCEVERVLWGAYAAGALAIAGGAAMLWDLSHRHRRSEKR